MRPRCRSWRRRATFHVCILAIALALVLPAGVRAANPGPWERISYNELPRFGPVSIYDPVGHRMIYYGNLYDAQAGYETGIESVMALSLGPTPTWTSIDPAGPTPIGLQWPSAIYDPIGHRMLMFGGWAGYGAVSDLWALSLDANPTWSQIFAGGDLPGARTRHTSIYDPVGQRMIVYGGGGTQPDVHALSLTGTPTWTRIIPEGPVVGQEDHTAIYDPVGQRMIVDGGGFMVDGGGFDRSSETWALSLDATPTWSRLTPASGLPPIHRQHGAIYDPVRNTLVIFGGVAGESPTFGDSNETWELSLGADPQWTPRTPAGGLPPIREWPQMIYDPIDDRMVLFGGLALATSHALDDTWSFALGASPAWTPFAPDGSPPNLAKFSTVVLDPSDGTILVYGGVPLTSKPETELRAFPLSGREGDGL